MNRIEREVRRRRRRRIADLNKDDHRLFTGMLRITITALAVIIGVAIWIWAAEMQAHEVEAAVLRSHRITDGPLYGPHITMVEPLPDIPPVDGDPPEAIEIKMASKVEEIPTDSNASNTLEEHWESLGRWMLTAYCPERCCNGKNAHRTASGEPMVVGDTVATSRLPFGTKLKIRGHVYTVTDRGVPYGQVDILHESHGVANDFGIQYAEVFILR